MKYIVGLILTFILGIVVAVYATPNPPKPIQMVQNTTLGIQIDTTQGVDSSESAKPRTIFKLITKRDNSEPNLKIEYPQIDNPQKKVELSTINETIKNEVYKIVHEMAPGYGYTKSKGVLKGSWFETSYTPIRTDDSIVSIKFNIYAYGEGAAHPNQYTSVFNYSVKQNKRLELENIFKPESDYLYRLSELSFPLVLKALTQKGYEDDEGTKSFVRYGTSPDKFNFQNILIGDNQIIVVFDPYQVGPYSAGKTEVVIPVDELFSILATKLD